MQIIYRTDTYQIRDILPDDEHTGNFNPGWDLATTDEIEVEMEYDEFGPAGVSPEQKRRIKDTYKDVREVPGIQLAVGSTKQRLEQQEKEIELELKRDKAEQKGYTELRTKLQKDIDQMKQQA